MTIDISIVNFFLHRRPTEEPFACVPLGPMYVCAAVEHAGYSVEFLDYQLERSQNPFDPAVIRDFLLTTKSDIVGISCMSNMLPFLLAGITLFKESRPDVFVVLGGAGASGIPTEILSAFPYVDAVASGEGEQLVLEIIEARMGSRNMESIAGLSFRENGQVRQNAVRQRQFDIDHLAPPAYHLLSKDHYLSFPILTSRGCPYRCVFCDISPNWDRKVARRSIDFVIDEIEDLYEQHGSCTFSILDDVFILSRPRVREFCNRILERGTHVEWSCMCRVDLLDDEIIDLLTHAGCSKIFLGIESGSERVRDIAGKGLKISNVAEVIAKAAPRFHVATSFMIGFPFESLSEFRETLLLAAYSKEKGACPQFCVLSPMPQAELTCSNEYEMEFDPAVVSGMAYSQHQERGADVMRAALTADIQESIRAHPRVFSPFYHFTDGMVHEKLELARSYGLWS